LRRSSHRGFVIRRTHLASQFGIGEALAKNVREHKFKSPAVIHRLLALVVAEYLLVQIAEQVKRFHAHVGSFESAFEQAPEVLHPVGMDAPVHVSDRVVNHLVFVLWLDAVIGEHRISVEVGAFRDVLADLRLNIHLASGRNDFGPDFTTALQCSPHGLLSLWASAADFPLPVGQVHVDCLAANVGFVRLDFASIAAKFAERFVLHGEPDAVHHEPCGLLSDADSAGDLVGTDAILAIGNHPNGSKPLVEADWRILENGSNLGGELPLGVDALALPFALIGKESRIGAATGGANDAVGPSQLDHIVKTVLRVGEEKDCLLECLWLGHVVHLSQSIGQTG
jgi:hypothetical protein